MEQKLRQVPIRNVGKLIIPEALKQEIDFLHNHVGATEWSGILVYKLVSGQLQSLKNLVFRAEHVYPMNIGSSAYTEFQYKEILVDLFEALPAHIEHSIGLIHTHHTMGAFFSKVDDDELAENAPIYNYYLSLIVDFRETFQAKLAIPSTTTTILKSEIRNEKGEVKEATISEKETVLLMAPLTVMFEKPKVEIPKWLSDRYAIIKRMKEIKDAATPKYPAYNYSQNRFGVHTEDDWWEKQVEENRAKYAIDTKKGSESELPLDDSMKEQASKTKQFLKSLIMLDTEPKISVREAVRKLAALSGDDEDVYEQGLDSNLELLHLNVYGSMDDFSRHCMEAFLELQEYSKTFGESSGYQILEDMLNARTVQ